MKLSYYIIKSDLLVGQKYILLYSTISAKLIALDKEVVKVLEEEKFTRIKKDLLDFLIENKFIVNKRKDELAYVLEENKSVIKESKHLYQSIQPSGNCQFGCSYCGQKHNKNKMNNLLEDRVFQRVKYNLDKKPFDSLGICWFGGEPLMGLSSIKRLSKKFLEMAHNNKIRYSAKIVTNGLSLKKEIFYDLLINYQVREFEVTLDGTAEHHDLRRHTKKGGKTYDIIVKNLEEIVADQRFKNNNPNIIIRSNIDKNNFLSTKLLIKELKQKGILANVKFYMAPIHSWGNDAHFQSLSHQEFADFEMDTYLYLAENGQNVQFLPGKMKNVTCMSLLENAELFDANGNLYNCSEVSQVPVYEKDNHKYRLADYRTTEFEEIDKVERPFSDWNDTIYNGNFPCKTCKILPVCGGSCPKLWKEGIVACPSLKFNIKDRMVLQFHQNNIDSEGRLSLA